MFKLRHVGITVTDMQRSLKLYRDYFGFDVVWDAIEQGDFIDSLSGQSNIKVNTVKMIDTSGGMIELLCYDSHPQSNIDNIKNDITKIGCSHLALTVTDIHQAHQDLEEMGLTFICTPQLSDNATAKVCFCRDYDGTLIELVEVAW